MDNIDKLKIINDMIDDIVFHIEGMLTEYGTEYFQEELYNKYLLKKQVLESERDSLTSSN